MIGVEEYLLHKRLYQESVLTLLRKRRKHMTHSIDSAFEKQLKDYRLTTAEITYHLPDHPDFLQTYLWQDYDIAPKFPVLYEFLDFWAHNLDGKLHSIIVASQKLITPAELGFRDIEMTLH